MSCTGCIQVGESSYRKGFAKLFHELPVKQEHGRKPDNFSYNASYYDTVYRTRIVADVRMEATPSYTIAYDSSTVADLVNLLNFEGDVLYDSRSVIDTNFTPMVNLSIELNSSVVLDISVAPEAYSSLVNSRVSLDVSSYSEFVYDVELESSLVADISVAPVAQYDISFDSSVVLDGTIKSILRIFTPSDNYLVKQNKSSNLILLGDPFTFDLNTYNLNAGIIKLSEFKADVITKIVTMDIISDVEYDIGVGELVLESYTGFIKAVNVTPITRGYIKKGNTTIIEITEDSEENAQIQFIGF